MTLEAMLSLLLVAAIMATAAPHNETAEETLLQHSKALDLLIVWATEGTAENEMVLDAELLLGKNNFELYVDTEKIYGEPSREKVSETILRHRNGKPEEITLSAHINK